MEDGGNRGAGGRGRSESPICAEGGGFAARKEFPPCPFLPLHPSYLSRGDEFFMKLAYNQALKAWNCGEVPGGAVIEFGGELIAQAHNSVEGSRDPTAHAEILAITQAAAKLGDWRLAGATLYVTKEPCPMCAGACIQTHIGTIAFGAWDPKLGACGSIWDIPRDPHIGHSPEVHGGVLEGECQSILTDFFAQRR